MTNHLVRRGARYSIRRKIPVDLQAHYGRKEIVRALGTSDPAEARELCRVEVVKIDQEFRQARLLLSEPVESVPWTPGFDAWLQAEEDRADDIEHGPEAWDEREARHIAREARKAAQFEIQVAAAEEAARRMQVRFASAPVTLKATATGSPVVHLAKLVEQWAKERRVASRTVGIANKVVERFWQHIGRIPVAEITRVHVIDFKNKLLESGQTPINTNKQLTILQTLLGYAESNLLATLNAAKGVRVEDKRNRKETRQPFDLPALRAIFSSPVYADKLRPPAGAGEASYWLPLLALFTGARLEELAQLSPDDVYEEHYHADDDSERSCWVIRITNQGEGQGVKNAGSIRRFPVHPELIARGFVALAQSQAGKRRIFDKLKTDNYGTEGGLYGKWFGKYLRGTCGVTDRRMVFHSFRHGFKDACRNCGVPEEVSDAFTGHVSPSISRRYGATNYPLGPMVDAVSRIRFPGLVLPNMPVSN